MHSSEEKINPSYQPEVTILIPVRNVAKYIDRCLECLLNQDYPKDKYKIWLLDNNSSDGTPQIAAGYKNRGVEIFQLGIDSPAKKYNLIWPKITSEVVGFADGDAYIDKDWLKKVTAVIKDDEVAGAGGIIKTANCEKLIPRIIGYDWQDRCEWSGENVRRIQTMHTIYKKKIIEEMGLFNEQLKTGYDVEMGYKITNAGFKNLRAIGSNRSIYHYLLGN